MRTRRGYTLMEMVVALGVASLLLGALGSAVVVAASALPAHTGGATESLLETSRALDRVVSDLEQAVYAPQRGATAATIVVPDRGGDGAPEVLRYAWAGSDGDPLTLAADGGGAWSVLDEVGGFGLEYDVVSRGETYPGAFVTNEAEVDAYPSIVEDADTLNLEKGKAFAQRFTPDLPEGVDSWRPTSLEVYARQEGAVIIGVNGETAFQIRAASGSEPAATVLAEAMVEETDLTPGWSWVAFTWSEEPSLDAGSDYFIVFGNTTNDSAAGRLLIEGQAGGGILEGSVNQGTYWSGGDGEPSWSDRDGEQILFRLHGEYETQNPDVHVTRSFVSGFTIDLSAGGDAPTTLRSAARALNTPEVLGAYWDADFASDPTALDLDADGTGDWQVMGGGTFDTSSLSGGVWAADKMLQALPRTDLNTPTRLEARWRCTQTGQPGAGITLAVDQGGARQALITLWLSRRDTDTQRVRLYYINDADEQTLVADLDVQSTGFVETVLVVVPDEDSAHLIVDGVTRGTYLYQRRAYTESDHKAWFFPAGSGVEVDRVRVLAGGAP